MLLWIFLLIFSSKATACGYPGSPSHSVVTFNTDRIQTGTVATYTCDPGFDILGPVRRLCVDNGTWIPNGMPVCVLNIAAGKAPMQSSISIKGIPQKAVDGSTSRSYNGDTCTMTESEVSPWWYVNLLEPFLVQLVRVDFGRSCCPNNKLATVVVRVGNNRPDVEVNPVCNRFVGKIEEGRPLFFPCTSSVSGAFVSIHLEAPTAVQLSICETFVYTNQVLPVEQCPTFKSVSLTNVATYNGRCYVFHNNKPKNLADAQKYCEQQQGVLVHETSPALQGFLSWELYKRHRKDPTLDYWNGAVRDPSTNSWRWIDGNEVILSFWDLPTADQNCSKFSGSRGWLWTDTSCDTELNFICQHLPVSCGRPEMPMNSTLVLGSTEISSTAHYKCDPGHLLIGPETRTCQNSGFYSSFPPKCSYLECGYPANIVNGGYIFTNGTRYYRSLIQYSCLPGYVLVGRSVLMCDTDKKWDGPPPRCDIQACHNPPEVKNGNVTIIINQTVPGTSAEYTCDTGYILVGKEVIYCDPSGVWSSKPPKCALDRSKLSQSNKRRKPNKSNVAARLNMGGIIALGVFGGFVFLAVIISIVVIIVRRNSNSGDSVDSVSTYESNGSREKLYQHQCWPGHPSDIHRGNICEEESEITSVHRKPKGPGESTRESFECEPNSHHHHHHHHHSQNKHRDIASLDANASSSAWCPKHDKRSGY